MDLILKNGKKIKLHWSPLVYEYLEDYDGGLEKLLKDINSENYSFSVINFVIYCLISACSNTEMKYREALSLINPKDYNSLIEYVYRQITEQQMNSNIRQAKNTPKRRHGF